MSECGEMGIVESVWEKYLSLLVDSLKKKNWQWYEVQILAQSYVLIIFDTYYECIIFLYNYDERMYTNKMNNIFPIKKK